MDTTFRSRKYGVNITVYASNLFNEETLNELVSDIEAIVSTYDYEAENPIDIPAYIKQKYHRDSWVSYDNTVVVVY